MNYEKVYRASRYDKGDADYLNCPFETKEEYLAFWEALRTAELAPVKEFEKEVFFDDDDNAAALEEIKALQIEKKGNIFSYYDL